MTANPLTAPIERIEASAYTVPTEGPEADGTLTWDATTLVLVRIDAGGATGIGYTYADAAAAVLIRDRLAPVLYATDAAAIAARWFDMVRVLRNLGRGGLSAMAVAAVDS
ncbi:MAG TPA: mandelate racemase, partial [Burkholderiaceae bacterium]|nr:mandelate racemase [Burkholderiaceae bacterium]